MLPETRAKRKTLLELASAGIAAVQPRAVLPEYLPGIFSGKPLHLLAIGKAATGMAEVALTALGKSIIDGIVVGPAPGSVADSRLRFLRGDHPVPDEGSFAAGKAVHDWLAGLEDDAPLLLLLSGGGSSLLEYPVPGVDAGTLKDIHRWCLGSGLPIERVNAIRARFSQLKAGGLAALAGDREKRGLVISDVMEGGVETVSSGPLSVQLADEFSNDGLPEWIVGLAGDVERVPRANAPLVEVASNASLVDAIHEDAQGRGMEISATGKLAGDAEEMATRLAETLETVATGLLVYGGETTVNLPPEAGRGGRNQQLALALARELAGKPGWCALALGSDGIDGNSDDAGALVDDGTIARAAEDGFNAGIALRGADAGPLLEAAGDLVHTGSTGTNVADVFLALKWRE